MLKCLSLFTLFLCLFSQASQAGNQKWGADYFPNTTLFTETGKEVKFFDDLIKDKIVAINFIYTRCPDTCPLETAQLIKVQSIMGDRLGKDVFFYSISIDPKNDTPEVLKEYKERFQANWTFLTGDEADITHLRKKLGLYLEEIDNNDDLNHNVSMIIGNQRTGRWMKRSPFENPHVLADQIGNWLTGWKAAPTDIKDYEKAPELRNVNQGERLFRTRCATCHSLTGKQAKGALGPDLIGINDRRDRVWLMNWLRDPDKMLAEEDPIAMAMYKQYNELAMPNMRLTQQDAEQLLLYIADETSRLEKEPEETTVATGNDIVAVMNSWIREAPPGADVNAGYMTLINVNDEDLILNRILCDAFKSVEMHEMTMEDGMMRMFEIKDAVIPANGQYSFKPGGKHLMLNDPVKPLKVDDEIDLTLIFRSGKIQTITVKVKKD